MLALFENMVNYLSEGEPLVLVTVLSGKGSVPGKTGAMLLASKEGRICGTVGGGELEYQAVSLCREICAERRARLERLDLSGGGMVCGGEALLLFLWLDPGEKRNQETARRGLARLKEKKTAWLALAPDRPEQWFLTESPPFGESLYGPAWSEGERLFAGPLLDTGRVYIFGGGHVACELVPVLARTGFRCAVLEERPEFASPARFPEAEEVILTDFQKLPSGLCLTARDYAVIMTRGHQFDTMALEQVLCTDAAYIGVMGSRRKKETVRESLRKKGFSEETLDRVITPIGLPILARTPEEIAVSIAAQLIQVRAERMQP